MLPVKTILRNRRMTYARAGLHLPLFFSEAAHLRSSIPNTTPQEGSNVWDQNICGRLSPSSDELTVSLTFFREKVKAQIVTTGSEPVGRVTLNLTYKNAFGDFFGAA